MLLLLLSAGAFAYLYVWWTKKRRRHEAMTKNVASLPGGLPIIGHAHNLKGFVPMVTKSTDFANRSGGVLKLWRGPYLAFIVTDPKLAFKLLNTCVKKNRLYDFAASWVGQGLVTAVETAIGLTENDTDSIVDEQYGLAVNRILNIYTTRFTTVWMHINGLYRLTATARREDETVKILKALPADALKKKKAMDPATESKTSSNRFKTSLDLLLELGANGDLTDQEIADEVDTMIMAGFDTSSTALTYIFVQLRKYPEVQDKVFAEIKQIFGDSRREVTKDDLPKLVYMEAVIKETLRMYPIGPILARDAEQDIKFDNFTVPAGSNIFVSIWGMHRHPMWGDPYVFRPERWLDPASLPEDPSAFGAFSLGRRGCIGKVYAMMAMKTSLVYILRRFKISGREQKLVNTIEMILKPTSGHLIEINYR